MEQKLWSSAATPQAKTKKWRWWWWGGGGREGAGMHFKQKASKQEKNRLLMAKHRNGSLSHWVITDTRSAVSHTDTRSAVSYTDTRSAVNHTDTRSAVNEALVGFS